MKLEIFRLEHGRLVPCPLVCWAFPRRGTVLVAIEKPEKGRKGGEK